jgi:hypothetical protein
MHTPGPWHWDSDPIKDDPLGRVRFRVVAKGRTITQCYYPSGDEQAEADTKLIAAAPSMLKALKELVREINSRPQQSMAIQGAANAACSAIAKAEGKQP